MYPVDDVLTAVSISPSRPPIAWKNSSCGVSPDRYELDTNPRDSGPKSSFVKCGSVRPANPNGMRLPSTFCCPTHAIICEMLMKEPLDPAVTMRTTLLVSLRDDCAERPASSRALLSTWLTWFSNDSSMVRPGCASSSRACSFWVRRLTSFSARSMVSEMTRIVRSSATVSPMPMEKPCCSSQWLAAYWHWDRKAAAAAGPASFQMTWMRDPADAPSVRLHRVPVSSSPPAIRTWESAGDRSAGSPSRYQAAVRRQLTEGRMAVMIWTGKKGGRGGGG